MDKKVVDFRKTGRYRQLKKEMEEKGDEFFKWVKVRKEKEKAYYLDAKSHDDYRRQFWIPKNWYNKEEKTFTKAGKIEYIKERIKKEKREEKEIEEWEKEVEKWKMGD